MAEKMNTTNHETALSTFSAGAPAGTTLSATKFSPETPPDLRAAGYRIELGKPEAEGGLAHLQGKYWWTWTVDGVADVLASCEEWDSEAQAIDDGRINLACAQEQGPFVTETQGGQHG